MSRSRTHAPHASPAARTPRPARSSAPARARTQDARSPLARAWPLALAALFVAALAWRLAYLSRLSHTPLFGHLRADEIGYWDWASNLLAGRPGTDGPFFFGPLYPHLLAAVRAVAGSDILAVLRVQAVWGALAVVLLADTARRVSRPGIALGVGVALAFHAMATFFDGLVLMESPLFALEALLVWGWARAGADAARGWWPAALGLCVGLIAQSRATGVLLIVPTAALLLSAARAAGAPARRALLTLAGVVLVTMLPAMAWNWTRSHELIPFTYNLGYNLYVGNGPRANGGYVLISDSPHPGAVADMEEIDGRRWLADHQGLRLSPAASSRHWTREALAQVARDPGLALRLAWQKLRMLLSRLETPQLEDLAQHDRMAGPVGLPWLGSFAFLGLLGLIGLVVASGPLATPLRLYVALTVAGTLPFFVTDRYRHHLVPALAVLAAYTLAEAVHRVRARDARGLAWPAAATTLAALAVFAPLPGHEPTLIAYQNTFDVGTRWLDAQRPDLAVAEFERGIALERAHGYDRDPDPALVKSRADLHYNYAITLKRLGRAGESLEWLRAAARDAPHDPRVLRALAEAERGAGDARAAESLMTRTAALPGGATEALYAEGFRAAREGRLDDAERAFRASVAADARQYAAWGALVRVCVQRGDARAAAAALRDAEAAGMPPAPYHVHEALVAAARGDAVAMERALAQVPPGALVADPALARVAEGARVLLNAKRR